MTLDLHPNEIHPITVKQPVNTMIVRTLLVILLCSGFWTTSAWGQLKTTETEDVDIIYTSPLHKYLLPQLVSTFTNSYNFHRNLFGYTPTENISILMQDFGDFGHGGADALPTNNVNIGIGPFNYVYETMPASERMNWLMHHELTHIVTTDMPNKTVSYTHLTLPTKA